MKNKTEYAGKLFSGKEIKDCNAYYLKGNRTRTR